MKDEDKYFWWAEKFKPVMEDERPKDMDPRVAGNSQEVFEYARISKRLWTLIEGDNGELFISSGFHFVNRLEHFITEIPYDEELEIPF